MDTSTPLSIDDYKKFALAQAAMQQPDQAQQGALASQMQSQPQQVPQGAGGVPAVQPDPNAPSTATVTQVQQHQGPIKTFLSQFLYGAGQGLVAKAGLETDPEKQTRLFNQQQATASAGRAAALQKAQIQNYQSQTDQRDQQNALVDTSTLGIPGLTGQVMQKDLPKVLVQHIRNQGQQGVADTRADSAYDLAHLKYGDGEIPGPANTTIKDIAGRSYLLNKRTGEKLKDLGESNAVTTAGARARAQAQYGLVNTMDDNANPTSVSRLTALQTGAPTASFDALKQIGSDRVGINQYADILDNKITPNLKVLNDPTQRAIIAHTLSEADKNPGAIQALLTSGAQSGLSPQGAALAAGIMQGREFGGVARKYGGNMNGTEGLMNRIMSNQASPLNSEQLNRELIQNDRDFTRKAMSTLGGITSHRVTGTTTPMPAAPTTAPAGHSFFSQFGGSAKQP